MSQISKEIFQNATRCDHCNVRFDSKTKQKGKRVLIGQDAVLEDINHYRQAHNLTLLVPENIICRSCFYRHNYSAAAVEQDDLHSDTGTPDSLLAAAPPLLHDEASIADGREAGSASNTAREETLESKCVLCGFLFDLSPTMPKLSLVAMPLMSILLSGERFLQGLSKLASGNICERCYIVKLRSFHEMWGKLPGVSVTKKFRLPEMGHFSNSENQSNQGSSQQTQYSQMSWLSQQAQTVQDITGKGFPEYEEDSEFETEASGSIPPSPSTSDGFSCSSNDCSSSTSESEGNEPKSPDRKRLAMDPRGLLLPIKSVAVSGKYCCICGKINASFRPGFQTRMFIYRTMRIYISKLNRICGDHRNNNAVSGLNEDALQTLVTRQISEVTQFDATSVMELHNYFLEKIKWYEKNYGRLSFGEAGFYSDKDYHTLFSINREQFYKLHTLCRPHLRNTSARSTEDALAIFLMKLRLNPSNTAIGCFFNTTRRVVEHSIKVVRKILVQEFVPMWLGFGAEHINREEFIGTKTSQIAKTITGAKDTQAICIIDGTYLYFQKSQNYRLQRKTYSLHKYRNLLKVMMVVSSTGYILAAEGPWFGDNENNDSNIFKTMMNDRDGFRSFFKEGDFIIEDRGFRDCNTLLTSMGFSIKMPHFLGKRKQHSTLEANESRLVTKLRWWVESLNGRIKNVYAFFRNVIPNTYIRKNRAFHMFQISCALLNAFSDQPTTDPESEKIIGEQMLARSELCNLLQSQLEDENYIRMTTQWKQLDEDSLLDFPRLTMENLRSFTFGVYQLKQAASYMCDTMGDDGKYDIFYHDNLQKHAIRFRINSRHHSGKTYDLWIGYNTLGMGEKSILGWYCKCPNGARVVGCCAHIAAVVWYLSYARYCNVILAPGKNLATDVRDARHFKYENQFIDISAEEEEILEQQIIEASTSAGPSTQVSQSNMDIDYESDDSNYLPDV